jgi:hypothetical protein
MSKYDNTYTNVKRQMFEANQKMKNEHRSTVKDLEKNTNESKNEGNTESYNFSYYSNVLQKPFASLSELKAAEAKYFEAQRAKEDKAATKKADAKKVEDAFIALNAARKEYKTALADAAEAYSKKLVALKETFDKERDEIKTALATAEKNYSDTLKAFTEKYPEGYHLTLKDGDFETTIHSSKNAVTDSAKVFDIFDMLFRM